MKSFILIVILFAHLLHADTLTALLKDYEETSDNSLQTVDEKLGHVLIYSQKELKLMQHHKLSDVLKELPLLNLNRNRYGLTTPSLAGTKTTVSGFFRLFINDHEVSSVHTQSFALSWGEMPLDFVDHIEVYYGESSFSLGNETGIYFIRVYTKSAIKENATQLKSVFSDDNSFSQSLTHTESFENGWSYLLFLNQNELKNENTYKNQKLYNDTKNRYLYLDVSDETTKINIGYSDLKKDNYMGLSNDIVPTSGKIISSDYFIDLSKQLSRDKSLKIGASYHIFNREYEEKNEKILLIPELQPGNTTVIPKEYNENLKYTKASGYISKKFTHKNNNLLTSLYIKNKTQKLISRKTVNALNQEKIDKKFNDFTKETTYSLILEDDYKINNELMFIANAKFDKYDRDAYLDDSTEQMYRVGTIYTPFKNFGLKSFYTKTYLPPSFFNVDFASTSNKNIKTQKYKIFTTEAVITTDKSKFGVTYHNVKIDDFIYFLNHPQVPGFINVDHQIKTRGLTFDYQYNFSNGNTIDLNYYKTYSSEKVNNSENGGFIKFMGSYSKLEYFTSLIYRNKYEYTPSSSNHVFVKDSFNLNMGTTYNYSKDLSFSLKGENLLDKSTESLFSDGSTSTNFSMKDFDRTITLSAKWVF
jgi:iron complex outermembrane receptor protein